MTVAERQELEGKNMMSRYQHKTTCGFYRISGPLKENVSPHNNAPK